MSYIDGFVLAVPEAKRRAYVDHAKAAFPMFEEFGIARHVECWEADVPDGKVTDFRRAVKARPDEKIVFAWFEYPSKAARDEANQKMRTDPRMQEMTDMPFDGSRMIYGGFETISDIGTTPDEPYVSASLFAVPTANKADFTRFSKDMAAIFRDFGAARLVDAWADDVPKGEVTDFQGAVQAKDDEAVAFSWIEWPSKAASDEAWPKIMEDPRMKASKMPFDGQRMVFGGFTPVVNLFAKTKTKA